MSSKKLAAGGAFLTLALGISLLLAHLLGAGAAASAASTDPVLRSLSFSSETVYVGPSLEVPPADAQLEVAIALGGTFAPTYASAVFQNAAAPDRIVAGSISGSPLARTCVIAVTFAPSDPLGTWHLYHFVLTDAYGSQRIYDESHLQALGFPTTVRLDTTAITTTTLPGVTSTTSSTGSTTTNSTTSTTLPSTTSTTDVVTTTTTLAPPPSHFSDLTPAHPYYTAANWLAERGVVAGFTDGSFGSEKLVKRMQFAKMLVLALGFPVTIKDECFFTDVPSAFSSDPLYPDHYVAVATKSGLVEGYLEDNAFRPENPITRAQLLTMLVRAGGVRLETPPLGWKGVLSYSDPTHGENTRTAEYNHLLTGVQGLSASWNTGLPASRGECAQALWNILNTMGPLDQWTQIMPTLSPPARDSAAMVYVPQTDKMLLFGGGIAYAQSPKTFNDLWAYDPQTRVWTQLHPSGPVPSPRNDPQMVCDSATGKLILFGGVGRESNGHAVRLDDTWSYDPATNTWTELHPSGSPSAFHGFATMAYDSLRGKVILLGEFVHNDQAFDETWEYDPSANTWTNCKPSGSIPFHQSGTMAFDSSTGKILFFGVFYGDPQIEMDTWEYDPVANSWSDLKPTRLPNNRWLGRVIYDSARGKMVTFGGAGHIGDMQDVWEYDPGVNTWGRNPMGNMPSARDRYALAYDPERQQTVLFGGVNSNDPNGQETTGDTWIYKPMPAD